MKRSRLDESIDEAAVAELITINKLVAGEISHPSFPFRVPPLLSPPIKIRAQSEVFGDGGFPFHIRMSDNFAGLFKEYVDGADCTVNDFDMVLLDNQVPIKINSVVGETGIKNADTVIVRPKMIEAEKRHYLKVMQRDVFPEILNQRLAWDDKKLWAIMVKGYNFDIDLGLVELKRRTAGDLILLGKDLEWCSCNDQEKSKCKCVVPSFPDHAMISTYTCTEQPASGLGVSWREGIGSSSRELDDEDSFNPEDLGCRIASQLLKIEISEEFTYEDLTTASFIYNDMLKNNNVVVINLFLKAPKNKKISVIKSLMKTYKST